MTLKQLRAEPTALLLAMAFVMPLTYSVWQALLNNFVVEQAAFTGREIGILQSLREIPGFLSFTVIFLLLVIREQRLALVALASLLLASLIPQQPAPGNETRWRSWRTARA